MRSRAGMNNWTAYRFATPIALILSLSLSLSGPGVVFADEQATLAVLTDQAFLRLHDEYVTLPNGTTERVARSTELLPYGWPAGQPKGIVEKQFIDEAIQSSSVEDLTAGIIYVFRNSDDGFDLVVPVKLDATSHVTFIYDPFVATEVSVWPSVWMNAHPACDGTGLGPTNCVGRGGPIGEGASSSCLLCDGWTTHQRCAEGDFEYKGMDQGSPKYCDTLDESNCVVGCEYGGTLFPRRRLVYI